jgi:hypothetical protein
MVVSFIAVMIEDSAEPALPVTSASLQPALVDPSVDLPEPVAERVALLGMARLETGRRVLFFRHDPTPARAMESARDRGGTRSQMLW